MGGGVGRFHREHKCNSGRFYGEEAKKVKLDVVEK